MKGVLLARREERGKEEGGQSLQVPTSLVLLGVGQSRMALVSSADVLILSLMMVWPKNLVSACMKKHLRIEPQV